MHLDRREQSQPEADLAHAQERSVEAARGPALHLGPDRRALVPRLVAPGITPRRAQGLIAVCDVTRYSTFKALDAWIPAAFRISGEVPLTLAVNKLDLKDQVMVLHDGNEPQQKAKKFGGFATWTSAKSDEKVNSVFGRLDLGIVRRIASSDTA